LFRFMLQSGLVKLLSGDDSWWNLSALSFHFETQPLPTTLAWYANLMPEFFLQLGVVFTFIVELVIPFLILMPRRPRQVAALSIVVFQIMIFVTGSYNYFNLLTIALCLLLLDDQAYRSLIPRGLAPLLRQPLAAHKPSLRSAVPVTIALVYILLSSIILSVTGHRSQLSNTSRTVLSWAQPFHIANGYGLFAAMTKTRPEIIIEGSMDGRDWKAYELPFKPGAVNRAPVWATPHQPRLDWQLWFAALAPAERNPWFRELMHRLLMGSEPVLALFEVNPFPDDPPRFLRAGLYQYHFSSEPKRKKTGNWWTREFDHEFFPVIQLSVSKRQTIP
ncbi:MAG TPA: lipase maturation factor family protein, partial [Porticoccus sp.]|nr:lipase maturation factor family protein [Porticoccus sp.]